MQTAPESGEVAIPSKEKMMPITANPASSFCVAYHRHEFA
jgi:hypothetical protein